MARLKVTPRKSNKQLLKELDLLQKSIKIDKQQKSVKEAKKAHEELARKINKSQNASRKMLLLSFYNTSKDVINETVTDLNKSIDEYRVEAKQVKKTKKKKEAPTPEEIIEIEDESPQELIEEFQEEAPQQSQKEIQAVVNQLTILRDAHKKEIKKLKNTLARLQRHASLLDRKTAPPFRQRIEKLKIYIAQQEIEYQKIKAELNNAPKLNVKSPPKKIPFKNRNQLNVSKIPVILPNNRDIDPSSISQISLVESLADKTLHNLLKLLQEHNLEVLANEDKIKDFEEQLNDPNDPARIPDEVLLNEIELEKQSHEINMKKLKKVGKNVMDLCYAILVRNKNLHYTENFKEQVKDLYFGLFKLPVFRPSKIALTTRRPITIPAIKAPSPRLTKKAYESKKSNILQRMQNALNDTLEDNDKLKSAQLPLRPRRSRWDVKKKLEEDFHANIEIAKGHKESLHRAIEAADIHLTEIAQFVRKGHEDAFNKSNTLYQNAVEKIMLAQKMLDDDLVKLLEMQKQLKSSLSSAVIPEDLFIVKETIPLEAEPLIQSNAKELQTQHSDALTKWRSMKHLAVNDPRYVRAVMDFRELNGKLYEYLICVITGKELTQGFFES